MIEKVIFYSWQSDLKHDFNWKLIEKSLIDSIQHLNEKNQFLKYVLDQATRGLPGSPDIVDSIFRKIDKSSIFIADITPIVNIGEKGIPNPNVLIELGYAVNVLGWDNVICICNRSLGKIETLPFDIKQRRITTYTLDDKKNKDSQTQKLTEIFKIAFPLIQENQDTYDKVTELFKIQLDHILLSISNHFNSLFKIAGSLIGIDVFYKVMDSLENDFININTKNDLNNTHKFLSIKIKELSELSKHPLLILNKKIDQITTIISLIESLELLNNNILSDRFYDPSILKDEKNEVCEIEILNMLLSDIAKKIISITDVWGKHLLIDPSRIEL